MWPLVALDSGREQEGGEVDAGPSRGDKYGDVPAASARHTTTDSVQAMNTPAHNACGASTVCALVCVECCACGCVGVWVSERGCERGYSSTPDLLLWPAECVSRWCRGRRAGQMEREGSELQTPWPAEEEMWAR
jgi:hypothetical protein